MHQGTAKDISRSEAPPGRNDRDRLAQQPPSSPPQAPQVPAFGSISYRPPPALQVTPVVRSSAAADISQPVLQGVQGSSKQPPSAPKAQLLSNAPTAPRAEKPSERTPTNEPTMTNRPPASDKQIPAIAPTPSTAPSRSRVSVAESATDSKARTSQPIPIPRASLDSGPPRGPIQPHGSQTAARRTSLQLVHPSRRDVIGEQTRHDTPSTSPIQQTHREISLPGQSSPAKVPTGPRAERVAPQIRQAIPPTTRVPPHRPINPQWRAGQPNLTWVRPGLNQSLPQSTPRGPSIMNTVPTKRDITGDEKIRSPLPENDDSEPFEASWAPGDTSLKDALDQAKAAGEKLETGGKAPLVDLERPRTGGSQEASTVRQGEDHAHTSQVAPKDKAAAVVEDGLMDLDEDDYEAAEKKFNHDLQMLEAKRPPTPRHHPQLLSLLDECDALASAAEDLANGIVPEISTGSAPLHISALGLPSPKAEDSEQMDMDVHSGLDTKFSVVREPTPPIESLPFIVSGPPTPFSQIDGLSEDTDLYEVVRARILDQLTAQGEHTEVHHEQIKGEYARLYRSWRIKNMELEEQERERSDAAPVPVPVETTSTFGGPVVSISGNRRVRGNTDVQMEHAINLSKLTAADEEEKRTNQHADRGANLDKEAEVPDMLTEQESLISLFDDRNNQVPPHAALKALRFAPKKDNFTAEEHDKFVDQYLLNPKRWGAIAEMIPGRDYQDCVLHYYLTKGICGYKEKEKAFLKIKKGRRGPRGPQGRARSSNLIPLYDGNTENDQTSTAVTETGRPKRTAAPVFGGTSDVEAPLPAITPLRRTAVPAKVDMNVEPSAEKPRRRGGGMMKEKGAKRGKAPLIAAAPGPSPQKGEKDIGRGKSREPKMEMEPGSQDLEGAQLLADLQSSHIQPVPVSQSSSTEDWMTRQPVPMGVNTLVGAQKMQQSQQQLFEPQAPMAQQQQQQQQQVQQQRSAQSTTSSYWSVPEHTDFQNLLGYFGTNWQAIADTMKTKSVTMVRNYYNRASSRDEDGTLKQLARQADDRIKRGEDMGPPPIPTTQTKRRNEPTSQGSSQRALAPSVEPAEGELKSPQLPSSKPVQSSPVPQHTHQPRYPALAQAESAPVPTLSQPVTQAVVTAVSRGPQQPIQHRPTPLQGPRSGFFSDDRSRPLLQAQSSVEFPKQQPHGRQTYPDENATRIRRDDSQHRVDVARRQQRQDFLERLEHQHHVRQSSGSVPQQPSIRSQASALSQPLNQSSQSTSSQVRIAPSQPLETESRSRVSSQSLLRPLDHIQQNSPTASGRLDLGVPGRARPSTIQSPVSARLPLNNMSPPPVEIVRPSSIAAVPAPPPPRPTPVPAKRSNIMSILNDEPSEPQPIRRRAEDAASAVQMQAQQSSVTPVQPYRPPSQPSQQQQARDQGVERHTQNNPLQQQQHRISASQSNIQQQQALAPQQAQQAIQAREGPASWVAAAQRLGDQRTTYQTPSNNSPHTQSPYTQQASRGPFQSLQRSHAPSPPPGPFSHSRNSSYNSAPNHHAQQQSASTHHAPSSSSQIPTPAAPNLQPSPYATIQPHQPAPSHQHSMQLQQTQQHLRAQQDHTQRQMEEQRHMDIQRRVRQDAALQQQEAMHQQYQHQQQQQQQNHQLQQQHQQQPQPPRSYEGPRRPSEQQTSFLRPKDSGAVEIDRRQERLVQYQETLMRQEQERKLEQARREQGRVYTPPIFANHEYGPPPMQQQQQPGQGHGRYDARR
ncbi:MAG: hypothetical protein Q9222_002269 [Ikaeria aurantiellina]